MSAASPSLRRAVVLGALAVALGLVSVRSVAQREAALEARIGPVGRVVVASRPVEAGATLGARDLAYRAVPVRFAPPGAITRAEDAVGLRSAVPLDRGAPLVGTALASTEQAARSALADGDRVVEVRAAGSVRIVRPGSRVDVVATRTGSDGRPRTRVLASALEVLDVRDEQEDDPALGQVVATVRASTDDALALSAAQDGDQALRILPRASWDR